MRSLVNSTSVHETLGFDRRQPRGCLRMLKYRSAAKRGENTAESWSTRVRWNLFSFHDIVHAPPLLAWCLGGYYGFFRSPQTLSSLLLPELLTDSGADIVAVLQTSACPPDTRTLLNVGKGCGDWELPLARRQALTRISRGE